MIGGQDTDAITRRESRSKKPAGVCVGRRVQVAEACCTRWPVVRELGHCDSVGFRVLGEQQAEITGIAARFWIRNGHSFGVSYGASHKKSNRPAPQKFTRALMVNVLAPVTVSNC